MRGYQGSQYPMTDNNNVTMSIPAASRLKCIIFSAFPGEGYQSTNTDTGLVDANTENIVT